MAKITRERRCPLCGSDDFARRRRRFWMRWLRRSKLLQCRSCRTRILLLGESGEAEEDSARDKHDDYG